MRKILIFGNSGSGKSTLSKLLADSENLAHLDLDILAWRPVTPPERAAHEDSSIQIKEFTARHSAHLNFYESFPGKKTMYTDNESSAI